MMTNTYGLILACSILKVDAMPSASIFPRRKNLKYPKHAEGEQGEGEDAKLNL